MGKIVQLKNNNGENLYPVIKQGTITAGISSDVTLNTTAITNLNLIQQIKVGSGLTISNGKIIIGAGVNYIKTSGSIYYSTGNSANCLVHCYIAKNGYVVNIGTNRTNPTLPNYLTVSTATRAIQVVQGDEITLQAYNQTAVGSVISNNALATYITVEVIG